MFGKNIVYTHKENRQVKEYNPEKNTKTVVVGSEQKNTLTAHRNQHLSFKYMQLALVSHFLVCVKNKNSKEHVKKTTLEPH